jgi:hypothetical protein
MTSKTNSDIALGDVRSTSYNAATANPYGYTGTIEDVIAQIRAEPEEVRGYWPLNVTRERHELLGFLGAHKVGAFGPWRNAYMAKVEDDTVEYGVPEPGFYTLAYARKAWPQSFSDSGGDLLNAFPQRGNEQ